MSQSDLQPKRVWVVGSAPDCDLVASNSTVSSKHCLIAEYDQGYALEDLGATNGTFVNGQRLTPRQPVWISRSDIVTLGRNIPLPWPQAQAAAVGGRGATTPLASTRVISIGRGEDNSQVLDYPMISWN